MAAANHPLKATISFLRIPENFSPPARNGSEDPGCDVSGGVDGIAAVAAQGNANEQHQQTHCDRLAARCGRFVLLVGQGHQTQQQHSCAQHLAHRRYTDAHVKITKKMVRARCVR